MDWDSRKISISDKQEGGKMIWNDKWTVAITRQEFERKEGPSA